MALFKAIIVSCESKKIGEKYFGKEITFDPVKELESIGIGAAGENGEFHTFIYDCPIFKSKIDFDKKEIKKNKNYLFVEIELLKKSGFNNIVVNYYKGLWIPFKGYIVPKGMIIKAIKKSN